MNEKEFKEALEQKTYPEIFNYRTRSNRTFWKINSVLSTKKDLLMNENKFPKTKNVLYIHIPFCATRCEYCPYYSTKYKPSLVMDYLNALKKEIEMIKNTPYIKTTKLQCVYIGGGTPSMLNSDEIKSLSESIFSSFNFIDNPEITFESNSASLNEEKIKAIKNANFTRFSLGVQSFDNEVLKKLGCAHTSEKAKRIIELLLKNDFILNLDMIMGLPHQSKSDWEGELENIDKLNLKPQQLSMFPLMIVSGTPLYENIEKVGGNINLESHYERLLEFDELTNKILTSYSYIREDIPVSFFHKKSNYPHKYTSTDTRVIGIGASAGTLIDNGDASNHDDVFKYINDINEGNHPVKAGVPLSIKQTYERYIWFGILYFNRSVPDFKAVVARKFKEFYEIDLSDNLYNEVIDNCKKLRFIRVLENGRIILTNRLLRILTKLNIGVPSII